MVWASVTVRRWLVYSFVAFATSYADQTEADHKQLITAIKAGTVKAAATV